MAKVTRMKSLNGLERQYARIMDNPNTSESRKTIAFNALKRYRSNIQKTATYRNDEMDFYRNVDVNPRSSRGVYLYQQSPVKNRGYSARVYRDGLISG